jgi:hypothetical protein
MVNSGLPLSMFLSMLTATPNLFMSPTLKETYGAESINPFVLDSIRYCDIANEEYRFATTNAINASPWQSGGEGTAIPAFPPEIE